jgi:hypothetical protein
MSMGKTRIGITDSLRDKWVEQFKKKEQAGNFESFLRTQDVSSHGFRSRVPCVYENKRFYHTMSFNETLALAELLHDPEVIDIKEQYPITDIDKSRAFAEQLGIKHPRYFGTAVDSIITWDFLCTLIGGKKRVVSVKPKALLEDKRTKEKLTLEEALANALGYEYRITTDEDVRTEKVRNIIRCVRGAVLSIELQLIYAKWLSEFFRKIKKNTHEELNITIDELAEKFKISYVQSFTLMQHGFWIKDVTSDETLPLRPDSTPFFMEVERNV